MRNIISLLAKNKLKSIILILLGILTIGSTVYILYALSLLKGIETFIRILFSITVVLIGFILCLSYFKSLYKKNSKYGLYIPFVGIYCTVLLIMGHYICKTYKV